METELRITKTFENLCGLAEDLNKREPKPKYATFKNKIRFGKWIALDYPGDGETPTVYQGNIYRVSETDGDTVIRVHIPDGEPNHARPEWEKLLGEMRRYGLLDAPSANVADAGQAAQPPETQAQPTPAPARSDEDAKPKQPYGLQPRTLGRLQQAIEIRQQEIERSAKVETTFKAAFRKVGGGYEQVKKAMPELYNRWHDVTYDPDKDD